MYLLGWENREASKASRCSHGKAAYQLQLEQSFSGNERNNPAKATTRRISEHHIPSWRTGLAWLIKLRSLAVGRSLMTISGANRLAAV